MIKGRDHSLDSNQNSGAEKISIFISSTEKMLKRIVEVAALVNVIEVELFIGKVKHTVCETLLDISTM